MRFHRFLKTLTAVAVALGVGLVVVASASADSGKIKFRGEAKIIGLAPGATTQTFEYKKDGSIKSVDIHTLGESVFTGPLDAECKPSTSTACDALDGSILFDVHSSNEVLRSVERVDHPIPILDILGFDAIAGKLSGDLFGDLTVSSTTTPVLLNGDIQMQIHGTATLGCFAFIPGVPPVLVPAVVAKCEDQDNPPFAFILVPLKFDVVDHGTFQLDSGGIVGSTVISGGDGHVKVSVAGDTVSGTSGTVVINDATLFTP